MSDQTVDLIAFGIWVAGGAAFCGLFTLILVALT